MSTPKPTSVDDTSLELDFGAKRIAKRLFKNDDKKHQRKVEHLARTKQCKGLTHVGRQLVLNVRQAQLIGADEG